MIRLIENSLPYLRILKLPGFHYIAYEDHLPYKNRQIKYKYKFFGETERLDIDHNPGDHRVASIPFLNNNLKNNMPQRAQKKESAVISFVTRRAGSGCAFSPSAPNSM